MTSEASGSTVPWLLTEQVRPWQLCVKVGTGAVLPGGSTIVTFCATEVFVAFHSSVTGSVTGNVPGAVKVLVGSGPVAVPWVPKLQEYVRDAVFSSVEPRPSKVQTFWVQEKVNRATGGVLAGWLTTTPVEVRSTPIWLCTSTGRTRTL